ncbi:hypothetical protein V6Z11_D07G072700 [Gossypium hirsutum]|uniref:Uncharacterized protein isoform X1 n=4 Tax=Gossypium TaxID=3633 RepID=A0ABM3AEI3_GOSHI|nr:uncharacterized protein LOC107953522 isoform X1 [Gossypium hirsutum]
MFGVSIFYIFGLVDTNHLDTCRLLWRLQAWSLQLFLHCFNRNCESEGGGKKMKAKRELGDSVDGERDLKWQRVVDSPSSPLEESLVPYNDDEDDERRALNHIGSREEDGHRVESEEEDDEDEDDPYP